jgi:hypothetical protein
MSPEISSESSERLQLLHICAGQPPFQLEASVVGLGNEYVVAAGDGLGDIQITAAAATAFRGGQLDWLSRAGELLDRLAGEAASQLAQELNATVTFSLWLAVEDMAEDKRDLMLASYRRLVREIGASLHGAA